MIVRFWEARIEPGRLHEAGDWVREHLLPRFEDRAGYVSAEVFVADEVGDQPARVVLLTRWSEHPDELDETLPVDGPIGRAHGWFFRDA